MRLRITFVVGLLVMLVVSTNALAQDVTPPSGHNTHHGNAATTPEATPVAPAGMGNMGQMGQGSASDIPGMMGQMQGMMGMMMGMEMSDDLRSHMEQMQGMMNMMGMMMSGQDMSGMMEQMQGMMNMMMGMQMSDDLRSHLEQMHGMMQMMSGMMGIDGMKMDSTAMPGHDMGSMGNTDSMDMSGGMDMGAGGHDMGPVSSEGVLPATENVGGQPLAYQVEDGVKVFELTARPVLWKILDDVTVTAYTYNGTVPGPMIRVTEGDKVRINFKNELSEPTSVHWHGMIIPNAMDGVPGMTQDAIQPGETFTYEFTASPAGTFMYHSHFESDTQVGLGLYAPFIIDPVKPEQPAPDVDLTLMLSEWRVVNGQTFPAMPMTGADPNFFTVNGKAFPATETINVKLGQRVRLRIASIGQFSHPMHLHGMPFEIVATDGHPVPEAARLTKDTVNVAPGERYDIEFVATEPGQWMLHCHILHHATNDGVEPGGLMLVVNVTE